MRINECNSKQFKMTTPVNEFCTNVSFLFSVNSLLSVPVCENIYVSKYALTTVVLCLYTYVLTVIRS